MLNHSSSAVSQDFFTTGSFRWVVAWGTGTQLWCSLGGLQGCDCLVDVHLEQASHCWPKLQTWTLPGQLTASRSGLYKYQANKVFSLKEWLCCQKHYIPQYASICSFIYFYLRSDDMIIILWESKVSLHQISRSIIIHSELHLHTLHLNLHITEAETSFRCQAWKASTVLLYMRRNCPVMMHYFWFRISERKKMRFEDFKDIIYCYCSSRKCAAFSTSSG